MIRSIIKSSIAFRKLRLNNCSCNNLSTSSSSPESIVQKCLDVRTSVQMLNDKFKGPLEKSSQKNTALPFVFLLGNHSSGKSSFINYICQRKVQTAGVAPTDDSFTIIVPGPIDGDRDGPTFIGDPDMGFGGLKTFGPQLIHHTHLKVRSNIAIKNFMIVDTPGMIDSPMVRDENGNPKHAVMDRGYDFESVCRWYSERADVILLFFDPDKPGTTGETLSILTNSLVGLDHKLHIILNKADQFRKIHDFARAYGSLCWNLSKVIHRKDLPRIYTMCLPKAFQAPTGDFSEEASLGRALKDLETTREEVVAEVLNAPKRRVDNEISRLSDSVLLLQMHLKIVQEMHNQYRRLWLKNILAISTSVIGWSGLTAGAITLSFPLEAIIASGSLGVLSTGGLFWWHNTSLVSKSKELTNKDQMDLIFRRLYARRLADNDELVPALWARVSDHLLLDMTAEDLRKLDKVTTAEVDNLDRLIDDEIPALRRIAAPTINKFV